MKNEKKNIIIYKNPEPEFYFEKFFHIKVNDETYKSIFNV